MLVTRVIFGKDNEGQNRGLYMLRGLFLYLIALIAGFAFGVFKRVRNQKKVIGVIDSLEQNYSNQSGRITHTAVVKYIVNKKEYMVKTTHQSTSFHNGHKVVVYYNSDNPDESFIRTGIMVYLFVYLLILMGTVLLVNDIYKLFF